jgi:hypothetical protein
MLKRLLLPLLSLIFFAPPALADEAPGLKVGGNIQTRAGWSSVDEPESPDQARAFSIAQARMNIIGPVLDPKISLFFELGFDYGVTELKDFTFDYQFIENGLYLRVGQGKIPFSRQMMADSCLIQHVHRSMVYGDPYFSMNRDIGFSLHNGHRGQGLDWIFGVYNGTGTQTRVTARGFTRVGTGTSIDIQPTIVDVTDDGDVVVRIDDLDVVDFDQNNVPDRANPTLALRLAYNHGGINLAQEADLEGGPFRFSMGLGALADLDLSDRDSAGVRATADFIAKVHGFSFSAAGFAATEQEVGEGKLKQKVRALGYYAQAGFTFSGFEPMARLSHTIHDEAADQLEITGGLAWYIHGQALKLQMYYSQIRTATNGSPFIDQRAQAQIQMLF